MNQLPHERLIDLVDLTLVGCIPELPNQELFSSETSRVPKSDRLIHALRPRIELYTGFDRQRGREVAVAAILEEDGRKVPINSRSFRNWLSQFFYLLHGTTLPASAREATIHLLEGLAFRGVREIPQPPAEDGSADE